MSFRKSNNGQLPTVKECIATIEQSYGGCEYLGRHNSGGQWVYEFRVPKRTWSPITYFTMNELRFTHIYGW